MLDHMSVSVTQSGLGFSGSAHLQSEFMGLEAYGLDIWSYRQKSKVFQNWPQFYWLLQACFVVIPINWMADAQAIQSPGLHFMIQSPTKQLKSAFVWHCDHRDK